MVNESIIQLLGGDEFVKSRYLHYEFEHKFIPNILFHDSKRALLMLQSSKNKDIISLMWQTCYESLNGVPYLNSDGLDVDNFDYEPNKSFILIAMPPP